MTKELAALAPAMKITLVAPTDDIILTVGAKRFRCAGVVFPLRLNELVDGNIFTADPCAAHSRRDQECVAKKNASPSVELHFRVRWMLVRSLSSPSTSTIKSTES